MRNIITVFIFMFGAGLLFAQPENNISFQEDNCKLKIGSSMVQITKEDSIKIVKLRSDLVVFKDENVILEFDEKLKVLSDISFTGSNYLRANSKKIALKLSKYIIKKDFLNYKMELNYTKKDNLLTINEISEYPIHSKCFKYNKKSKFALECLKSKLILELEKNIPKNLPLEDKTKVKIRFIIGADKQIKRPIYLEGNENYARYIMMSAIDLAPVIKSATKEDEKIDLILDLDFEYELIPEISKDEKKKKRKKKRK